MHGITGEEIISIIGIEDGLKPRQEVTMEINNKGNKKQIQLIARIDTPMEMEYYLNGGIMPFVLRQLMKKKD